MTRRAGRSTRGSVCNAPRPPTTTQKKQHVSARVRASTATGRLTGPGASGGPTWPATTCRRSSPTSGCCHDPARRPAELPRRLPRAAAPREGRAYRPVDVPDRHRARPDRVGPDAGRCADRLAQDRPQAGAAQGRQGAGQVPAGAATPGRRGVDRSLGGRMKLRTGRKCERNLYVQLGPEPSDDDPLVGQVLTPGLARLIVQAVNGRSSIGWPPALADAAHIARLAEASGGVPSE